MKASGRKRSVTGLRVTGGYLRGRRLRTPRSGVRPTADRVREALFARVGELEGVSVLDLYAGSGALGIEALSRGAADAVFVERARAALPTLRGNLVQLELEERSRVEAGDVPRVLRRLGEAGERFRLVLADPPYAAGEAGRALEALVEAGVLAEGAVVVVERGRRHPLPQVSGLAPLSERRYGDTVLTWLSASEPGGKPRE